MILSEERCREIVDMVKKLSRAEAVTARIWSSKQGNLRFACNTVTTSATSYSTSVLIQSDFGKRSGSVLIELPDMDVLPGALRRSEELARHSPESEEYMPPLNPQEYVDSKEHFASTALLAPEDRARFAERFIRCAAKERLSVAGFFSDDEYACALGNSNDLFVYHKGSSVSCSATARTESGCGAAKVTREFADAALIDAEFLSQFLVQRALLTEKPREIPAAEYPAILEPAAASGILAHLRGFFSRREADEGRSYFSAPGGKTKIGEKVADSRVTLRTDPCYPLCPSINFSQEGLPVKPLTWIERGVLKNLPLERYWGKRIGAPPLPPPANLVLEGGSSSLDELVSKLDRGVLVSHTWYIRTLDPRQALLTGLTRDGTFWVENGKIQFPIKNFRFNESPVRMLQNVEELSRPERATGLENWGLKTVLPALRLSRFGFSSVSDAV